MTTLHAVALWLALSGCQACPHGVVVEEAQPGFAAANAGLHPGDVLCGWERAASPPANPESAQGTFASPFDLEHVEIEQAPRGELTLRVGRTDGCQLVRLPRGRWQLRTRPALDASELAAYERALTWLRGAPGAGEAPRWPEVADGLRSASTQARRTWLFYRVGLVASEERKWDVADAALGEALRLAEDSGSPLVTALVLTARAASLRSRRDWDGAVAAFRLAIQSCRAVASPSLGEAMLLNRLGHVARSVGDHQAADDDIRRALIIQETLAPDSLDVADSLHNLAITAFSRGDVAEANSYHRRALSIREQVAPESLDVATSWLGLAIVALASGDLEAAAEFYDRTLTIHRRLAPERLPGILGDMAMVAAQRGDLAGAEDYQRQAVALLDKAMPDDISAVFLLNSFGDVALHRGDFLAAEDHNRRALAIVQRLYPGSLAEATTWFSLGEVAYSRGDLAAAEDNYRRALAIRERLAPDGLSVAHSVAWLGRLAWMRGQAAKARSELTRALGLLERLAPEGMATAEVLGVLGDVAFANGDRAAAGEHYQRSLDIRRHMAPGSVWEAEACGRLATLARSRQEPQRALELYRCALDAVETQRRGRTGADEVNARWASRHAQYYQEAIGLLVALGRGADAFYVLERYRARGLLALLAERDLVFSADVPAGLDRERRIANVEYDRALARVLDAKTDRLEEARDALRAVRVRQAAIREQVRAASPRLAALQYPEPLDLARTRQALDPGTLLLSYSIGDAGGYVFAVGPGPQDFEAVRLGLDPRALRREVARFRELLQEQAVMKRRQLDRLSGKLSVKLLRPVAEPLRRALRVVILLDGALHALPFAALYDPAHEGRYLVERVPLHVAASATVFAELRKTRRAAGTDRVVGFGDPDYSAARSTRRLQAAAPEPRSAQWRGFELNPLPASRLEVDDLRRRFPDSSVLYVGDQATEERAKTVGREATILHFACHALADESSPLDSSLALSIPADWKPGQPNGLLQAWEIFEQVRLDADLVTLSACGTALGKEMSGEGILGLTRAFQYAGARSVLASLWAVRDDSTAELMRRFYRHLRDGKTKDAALRAAQVEMIRGRASHPGRWAAFQLVGDWR